MVFYSMLLVVPSMAVAVSMGRRPIAGSCAGFTNMGIEKQCSICGASREKGEEFNSGTAESSPKRLV